MRSEGYSSWVCVCVSVKSHLTSRMSNRAINERAYSVARERQKFYGNFPEKTAFMSYAVKHEFTGLPAVSFFRSTHSEAPGVTQRVSTTFSPKGCLLILLACVEARTKQHHAYSYGTKRGQFSAHAHWLSTQDMQLVCAEGLHFSAFHFEIMNPQHTFTKRVAVVGSVCLSG